MASSPDHWVCRNEWPFESLYPYVMLHHTKTQGDLGVLKAKLTLFQQGFSILSPESEHLPFDLVAYRDGKFVRVQVKFRTETNGAVQVQFQNTWADRHGSHVVKWDKSEVDVVCVYCPDTDQCYFFRPQDFREGVILRIRPTKNGQDYRSHWAKDFVACPVGLEPTTPGVETPCSNSS